MLKYFEEAGKNTAVFLVIGFSFRDPYVDDIFLSHLREDSNRRLLVVSPSARENVKEYLLVRARSKEERKAFRKQVKSLNSKFGEMKTLDQIDRELKMLIPT